MSAEPSLQDALGWMRGGALGGDPGVKAALDAGQEAFDYRAKAVREALRTEAGQVLMEVLLDLTIRRAPVDHSLPTETEYLRYAQLRQGQNQVLAGVLTYYDRAETLEKARHAPAPVSDDAPDLLAGDGERRRRNDGGGDDDGGLGWLDHLNDSGGDAAVRG